ncbi:MAG: helix-turn-helix domain-containing protein [Oscillospiraceae bacterium]|nr:helix-turn-helix domain-containing protein [Oscillospiraceae bacterium]
MDQSRMGELIRDNRKRLNLTQRELAEKLHISDKAVSKWERGMGCPDVGLLTALSDVFGMDLKVLLSGGAESNEPTGGNMKKLKFYVCPVCGNLVTSAAETTVSCCGKILMPLKAQKADEAHALKIEVIENEFFVTSQHEMTKAHYISFLALLTGDTLVLKKQYPEWGLDTRLPMLRYGTLYWYCTEHGLFYQLMKAKKE